MRWVLVVWASMIVLLLSPAAWASSGGLEVKTGDVGGDTSVETDVGNVTTKTETGDVGSDNDVASGNKIEAGNVSTGDVASGNKAELETGDVASGNTVSTGDVASPTTTVVAPITAPINVSGNRILTTEDNDQDNDVIRSEKTVVRDSFNRGDTAGGDIIGKTQRPAKTSSSGGFLIVLDGEAEVSSSSKGGSLPKTGLDAGRLAMVGLSLLGAGWQLCRAGRGSGAVAPA